MRLLKITCFLMLCGCETSLLGEWNGTCMFADANQESLVEVTNTVERDNGYLLEGTMELYTWEDDTFRRYDWRSQWEICDVQRGSFDTEAGPYQFRIETERVGQTLEGDCIVQAPDSVGALVGSIGLER